ncbi:sulfite oxidase, mitochondrial [Microplitis mediator]|uniref:sulfite oxidase, mitochondrial n=1 Tax=Microplitis mediator TaxID=375433 RepID=UPI002554DE9D|nr:sulfite oxidase, mitochondrial [Microplitis mediator]
MCWRVKIIYNIHKNYLQQNSNKKILKIISNYYATNHGYTSDKNQKSFFSNDRKNYLQYAWKVGLISSVIGVSYYFWTNKSQAIELKNINESPGVRKNHLKTYTVEEVGKHDNKSDGIWVHYKEGVYDITNFVLKHPGGPEKIMMAAGGSIEPFWVIFANHNTAEIYELLESMRIGNLDVSKDNKQAEVIADPYANDPKRHKVLKVNGAKPFCGETPAPLLSENFLTPLDFFYVRNHLPVPEIDITDYELEIAIEDETKKILDFEAIKKYPKYTVTAAVMCGGNRRSEMNAIKSLKGLSWNVGAVGNASWTGARLCDVLADLKINEDDWKHVQFEGYDLDPSGTPYGGSIPISRALDPRADVLLAYEMNGQPIPRDHGYPIRVIVPGVVGARNVKWLGKIIISNEESWSQFQRGDYKGFSPSVDWDTVDFSKSPAILDMPVTSAICTPTPGESVKLKDGKMPVKGYAWSGGGKKIIRIDLTVDQGKTWYVADHMIDDENAKEGRHWSWTLWTAEIPIDATKSEVEVWVKAVDASYNVQPESFENIWNLRGLLCNAYHRVNVKIKK